VKERIIQSEKFLNLRGDGGKIISLIKMHVNKSKSEKSKRNKGKDEEKNSFVFA
jgi:hypothetical protein